MKPTNQEKLFALAAAAGKAAKDGNTDKALSTLNIMAHILDDESQAKAKEILDTLSEQEPVIKGVHNYIGGQHIEIGGQPPEPPKGAIDITHLPHDQALFCLVTSLGGHLRGLLVEEDEEEKKELGNNVAWLISMIAQRVTREDWDKAQKIINDSNGDDEPDAFSKFLSA